MTSEEFRTNPLLLRNQFERSGTFEIPVIQKEKINLENLTLIGYDKLSSGNSDQVVHFFLDDYKFEVLWSNPEPRIEKLSAFKAVLSPQFSIYSEMPMAIQIYNTFRSRWCGAYLQSKGIKVIPSVVWGEPDTFWFCFDGLEKNSIVAVSTIGVRNEKELFMAGYREMLRRIEPSNIICYGKPFDEMEGDIVYISYEETNNYGSKAYRDEWIAQIPQIPKDLIYEKGGGHAGGGNRFPAHDSQIKHIFRKKNGHTADTPENRELLLRVCNDESNYMGTDQNGNRWYVQILSDGRQVWVTTRDGIIQNAGINNVALPWHEDTGLNRPRNKGAERNMENTPCRRAFLSMYYLLDSVYSQFPYKNLAVVLGDINPTLFKGSMSADPAAWEDFCEYYQETESESGSEFKAGYDAAIRFLRVYEEEWGYPIPYAMEAFTTEKYREYYFNHNP